VSDIVMPGVDGVELAERMMLIRPAMKVLYVSGYANHATTVFDNPIEYLQKPFGPMELARKVAQLISEGPARV
jgi:two-component SAPR family response regulator